MKKLYVDLGERGYSISIGRGLMHEADKIFNLDRRVMIVTDSGVPRQYAETVASLAKKPCIVTVDEGEGSKSVEGLTKVLSAMVEHGMTRGDCVVAVGGGVIGDLGGFAASTYMRGVDFYNMPTTVLSMVDSSIGGKTAINFGGIKNIVGSFYQPKAVLIDPDCLSTLDERMVSNGLAEVVKMSLTSSKGLFEKFEKYTIIDIMVHIDDIICDALDIKRAVVEADEKESGLRRILNFGHTLGHGIEAEEEMRGMYHGECVALGMLPMCPSAVRERLIAVLKKLGLPTEYSGDIDKALEYVTHDKKTTAKGVAAVLVPDVGSFEIREMTTVEFAALVREVF